MNYKKLFEAITYTLLLIFFTLFFIILLQLLYDRSFIIISKDANFLVAFIVLGTSLVTGGFFLVKIYIENQLGIKEKEMLKEYQEALDKQTKEQNLKFNKLEEGQRKILDWINEQHVNNRIKNSNKSRLGSE